jgi:hypothetical protein
MSANGPYVNITVHSTPIHPDTSNARCSNMQLAPFFSVAEENFYISPPSVLHAPFTSSEVRMLNRLATKPKIAI